MRLNKANTSEPPWVNREMLFMNNNTPLPSSYSEMARPVKATCTQVLGHGFLFLSFPDGFSAYPRMPNGVSPIRASDEKLPWKVGCKNASKRPLVFFDDNTSALAGGRCSLRLLVPI